MSPTEINLQSNYKWRMALVALVAFGVLYYWLGYIPTQIWILVIALAVVLVYNLIRGEPSGPCVVLNDEGVFDRRLKVGVIRWEDIRKISLHSLQGAEYISLELHDMKPYDARRPAALKLASQAQRGFGMSTLAISTNGLDMDTKTLAGLIHDGCERASKHEQGPAAV